MSHTAVILAAGKGTRMKSELPKVMHRVAGKTLVGWVVDAVLASGADRVVVVVGYGADLVADSLPDGVETCLQAEQRGTGHAVSVAMDHLGDIDGDLLVLPGDTPLIDAATLRALLDAHRDASADTTILGTRLADPHGYGRIVRRPDGTVERIVEQKDASADEAEIDEVNAGMYVFSASALRQDLDGLTTDNAQGEYYLPDVVASAVERGAGVGVEIIESEKVMGVNTHRHLATVAAIRRSEINGALMDAGVHMTDPSTVYIDHDVVVEPGASILPNVHLEAGTVVSAGATVGPDTHVSDSEIGPGARVWYSVIRGASIGARAEVGPYASLRPEAVLEEGSKAGTFVEIKKSVIGPGSKVPHLSYVGDATVGARTNIGAGTITVNYDGFAKHRTVIGEGVRIGSDTMLIAPVTVGDGAMTAAGSAIDCDVEAGALGIARARQTNKPGFAARLAARYRGQSGD